MWPYQICSEDPSLRPGTLASSTPCGRGTVAAPIHSAGSSELGGLTCLSGGVGLVDLCLAISGCSEHRVVSRVKDALSRS